jgi:chromatin segregation and condensation protein Rec8/ScpA/Scc1 (kleisin family)
MAPRRSTTALAERAVSALGVVAPPPIHIESPRFVGSLATLFTCARDHTVDLNDVPLLPICESYLEYVLAQAAPNLDEAAAALAALAYLLERKAWGLLPVPEVEPAPEEMLELPTSTTYEYRLAMDTLREWHEARSRLFFRAPDLGPNPYEHPYEIDEVTTEVLANALADLLRRTAPPAPPELYRHKRSLASQMGSVLLTLSYDWKTLSDLVPRESSREDVVYWFLSLLELMRLGQASARIVGEEVEFARP